MMVLYHLHNPQARSHAWTLHELRVCVYCREHQTQHGMLGVMSGVAEADFRPMNLTALYRQSSLSGP